MIGKKVYVESVLVEALKSGKSEVTLLLSNGCILAGLERVQIHELGAASVPRLDLTVMLFKENRNEGQE